MTSMDTDSESQDSDDGRRFRFEATRKDAAIIPNTVSKEKSHRKKSKHRSHLEDKNYRDRKERSKHETSRKESQHSRERDIDEKESRHITKHAKYGTHKDYKSTKERDSTSADKNLKYSIDSKDRLRDLKHSRERERERNGHRKNSREHSRDRSYDDRSSVDRYRSKYHDRHKYSRHKSRDRSCQSNRLKLSDNDKSRNEHGRHDSIKKTKDKRLHPLENEHSAYQNIEQIHDCNESHSMSLNKVCKTATPLDTQDCKDLDLRDFNVLSETDENVSDISDSRSLYSSSYCHKTKVKREQLKNQYECVNKKQVAPDQEHVEELQKVNCKNNTPLLSSSNNNPSAISDTLLDSLEPTSIMNNQVQLLQEKDAKCDTFKYPSESSEKNNSCIYGPVLPPQIKTSQCTLNENKSTNLYTTLCTEKLETKECIVKDISDEDYNIELIGPCLPKIEDSSNNHENSNTMSALNLEEINQEHQESHSASKNNEFVDDATTFGPALPPHLIKQPNEGDTKSKLIGPVIPENLKLLNEEERMAMYSQLEDEDSDTPSLTDYGATNNGQKYQELQTPGLHYFHEIKQEVAKDVVHKREKWMMELPPTRAADFGLRARKFRLRPGPDMSDRSCWTDTPEDRINKRKAEEEAAALRSVKKPDSIDLLKEKPKKTKKQEKSLLEIHQSKLKKRKKKEEKEAKDAGLPTRRPFDRNIDLQVNRFMDPSQKRSVLMKAGMLNDRFSRGQI